MGNWLDMNAVSHLETLDSCLELRDSPSDDHDVCAFLGELGRNSKPHSIRAAGHNHGLEQESARRLFEVQQYLYSPDPRRQTRSWKTRNRTFWQ